MLLIMQADWEVSRSSKKYPSPSSSIVYLAIRTASRGSYSSKG